MDNTIDILNNRVTEDKFDIQSLRVTGIKVNYLYVCERKLWLFDKGICMESTSDKVLIGKIAGENAYRNHDRREVLIDNLINIDIVGEDEIMEVKYSNKLADADRIQILYYLYYLKQMGIKKKGSICYPKIKKREEIELTDDAEREIEKALMRLREITSMPKPPELKRKPYCTKCAYYELCWSD